MDKTKNFIFNVFYKWTAQNEDQRRKSKEIENWLGTQADPHALKRTSTQEQPRLFTKFCARAAWQPARAHPSHKVDRTKKMFPIEHLPNSWWTSDIVEKLEKIWLKLHQSAMDNLPQLGKWQICLLIYPTIYHFQALHLIPKGN